ncbi:KdsC family phosphatase [Pseudodesulfovibrio tunisiensis]|uniref:KdsC family phosphatase n=1 Tax=Pseudodesulfovibrio tunisiensis TaxID=463192 RepID=UPI001FB2BB1B|nr:HAD hydrolase family protein [Pseudodesulfovibrio tunisiensis]
MTGFRFLVNDASASGDFYALLPGAVVERDGNGVSVILPGGFGFRLESGQGMTLAGVALRFFCAEIDILAERLAEAGIVSVRSGDCLEFHGLDSETLCAVDCGVDFRRVRLVVYDFDGVMTDNRVFVAQDGTESVAANRSDGLGVGMIRRLGLEQVILSTEPNPVVRARAEKLGLEVSHDVRDKAEALRTMAETRNITPGEVLYVGNDVNDLAAMQLAGVRVAPADAYPRILALAHHVTRARGGHGVVRELADLLNRFFAK